ncbi:cobalamin biosynthesis protein CobD [Marinilabiliaceae bacterium JC040]|nr:cobalamin biosynthesis protein CobD [Marinilabiliaceae bacterium JC040]
MDKYIIIPLIVGYILDLILGDPRNLPHPIILFGNSINFLEKRLNRGLNKRKLLVGGLGSIILIILTYIVFLGLTVISKDINEIVYYIISSIFVFYGLANHSLIKEGKAVITALEKEGIEAGRKRLSWIVGRETSNLNSQEIYKAVLETMSENLSDGVVAPLLYYSIFGVPGMMAYKMINTLDSMIGYKSDKYFYYGKIAAYIDDIANFIPARITALLMFIAFPRFKTISFIIKYGHKHSSPNAGYPESALSGILNCQFGGPNYYYGKLIQKPYIGNINKKLSIKDFYKTLYINHAVSFISVGIIILIYSL